MYSYEERIRAVQLYIKLGERASATIHQLGYPTKSALKSWRRTYERRLDLPHGYVRAEGKYAQTHKERAVEHDLENGLCIAAAIRALGYPKRDALRAWIAELRPEPHRRVVGRSGGVRPPEVKQAAVIALCTRQASAKAAAQDLGVSRQSLHIWKNQLLGREAPASMKRRLPSSPSSEREELERRLEALRREVHRLQLEHDLLKKANELIKKDMGVDQQILTSLEKTMLVDALRPAYALSELLEALDLARSTDFDRRARLRLVEKYAEARRAMAEIFERNHRC